MPSYRPILPKGLGLKSRPSPLIMGIVNVTEDSFYAQSRAPTTKAAIAHALKQVEEGADWVDVGGQSTRPGSKAVPEELELSRVLPVVKELARIPGLAISIDTDKARVARLCRRAGASVLNDVSALRNSPDMMQAALDFEAVILMHRGGESVATMQLNPSYSDVLVEVKQFLRERIAAFVKAGGRIRRVLIDCGIGFGKDLGHNLLLLKHLSQFAAIAPVVLGASRKSFLGRIAKDAGPEERLGGSIAAACWAALQGVAVVRTHDVGQTRRALLALAAIRDAR